MIEATGLTKTIGRKNILQDINLQIKEGEFVTVFGPNGAGKSTLLKTLALISKPTKGRVIIGGKSAQDQAEEIRKRLGVISHQTFLNDNLSARENLNFYGRMYGVHDLKNRIFDVLHEVGLDFALRDPVRTFSRGMQQRLSIARAILHDPDILFLDEPYTGLDPLAIQILNNVLAGLQRQQRTVFLITHNFDEGMALSDRILFVVRGRIVYDGHSSALTREELKGLYLSKAGGAA